MRIGFLVPRPTQFEAPFYRFAARDTTHLLEVLFTADDPGGPVFDPELGREVSWGLELLEGYPHVALPGKRRPRRLKAHLYSRRYDLLIANGYTAPGYLRAAWAARRAGTATALRLDSVLPVRSGAREAAKKLLFRFVLTRAYDCFLATGTSTRRYLTAMGVPDARVGLFPYAIDVDHFRSHALLDPATREGVRSRYTIPTDAQLVLAVSKLNQREAPWGLIEAFAGLHSESIWLLVAGDGPMRASMALQAASLRVTRAVFAGYVPYRDLPALYGAADVFVHVPREERWGVSVAEALAAGLPVVVSEAAGAAHDLISEGQNGFTCRPGNTEELRRRIDEALSLDRHAVSVASARILDRWDYASTWQALLEAAGRAGALRAK